MEYKKFSDIVAIAQKLDRGEINPLDPNLQKASKALSNLAKSDNGRTEIAQLVGFYVNESYNKFDISPLIFEKKHFNYGDEPIFKTRRKGIVAYETAPNAYVPKSRNYSTEFTMSFINIGVRPECMLEELRTGRLDSLASLIRDAQEALERLLMGKVWTLLAQTWNETHNKDNYIATNTINQASLDKSINYIRKKTGTKPTIIGDYDLLTEIEKFEGFKALESVYNEIRTNGLLGMYRGCELVYLPEIIDPVSKRSIVPTNKIMIVGKKVGYAATKGDVIAEQEKNIDDMSWSCRIDKKAGWVVTEPTHLFVIERTA